MSWADRRRAELEAQRVARERQLDQLRRRLARRAWTVADLAAVLDWPGGRVGIPARLRDLESRGEAHEINGAWHAGPAPTEAQEAAQEDDMPTHRELVTADLAQHGPSNRDEVAARTGLTRTQAANALGALKMVGLAETVETPDGELTRYRLPDPPTELVALAEALPDTPEETERLDTPSPRSGYAEAEELRRQLEAERERADQAEAERDEARRRIAELEHRVQMSEARNDCCPCGGQLTWTDRTPGKPAPDTIASCDTCGASWTEGACAHPDLDGERKARRKAEAQLDAIRDGTMLDCDLDDVADRVEEVLGQRDEARARIAELERQVEAEQVDSGEHLAIWRDQVGRLHGQIGALLHLLRETETRRRAATVELEQIEAVEHLAEERGNELAGLTARLVECVLLAGLAPRSTTPGILVEQVLGHLREQRAPQTERAQERAA